MTPFIILHKDSFRVLNVVIENVFFAPIAHGITYLAKTNYYSTNFQVVLVSCLLLNTPVSTILSASS